ncbi:unnamed protein product [Brachionus calyciflorus]|uniref:Uncharacterized protein n=1 Tax=Brachionus calyciflorus TaxID=104777 RepID=A0A813P669_9BILA|nr:unnamed protein product [Brachionus calyciflorus]
MKYLSSIGLKSNYIEDTDFKQWINSIFALTLCPLNKLDDQWEKCLNNQPKSVLRIEEFLDNFADNYFEGGFPKEMWNHFGNENLPRTNNNLEGYNVKLKKYIVISRHFEDITIDVYMKRIAAMLVIYKKKKEKIGVAQQNISSSDEENESDDSSGEVTDDGVDSDDY